MMHKSTSTCLDDGGTAVPMDVEGTVVLISEGTRFKTVDGGTAILISEEKYLSLNETIEMIRKEIREMTDVALLLKEKDDIIKKLVSIIRNRMKRDHV